MITLNDLRNISVEQALEEGINKVAVYGTLRKGNSAHKMVENLTYEGKSNLTRGKYQMFTAGAFPYILDLDELDLGGGHPLREAPQIGPVIEVYSMPDDSLEETLRRLDMYEGFPALYNRDVIESDDMGKFFLYTYAEVNEGDIMGRFIVCNDWNVYTGIDNNKKKERDPEVFNAYQAARAQFRRHRMADARNIEYRAGQVLEELPEDDPREDR